MFLLTLYNSKNLEFDLELGFKKIGTWDIV